MRRNYRNWYCSSCHFSHPFEKVENTWFSRERGCHKEFHIPSADDIALAYSVERRLNFQEYAQ